MAEKRAERAPLASEEGIEESPLQLAGTKMEITRGKEFKVKKSFYCSLNMYSLITRYTRLVQGTPQ